MGGGGVGPIDCGSEEMEEKKESKSGKPHFLFYLQAPLLLTYGVGKYLQDFIKGNLNGFNSMQDIKEMEFQRTAMEKSAKTGSFYFSELNKLKKAEKEQAKVDYNLLEKEVENPSESYVNSLGSSFHGYRFPEKIGEGAENLLSSLNDFDPKRELSLKYALNQGVAMGDEIGILFATGIFNKRDYPDKK